MANLPTPEWIPLFPLPNVVFFPKTYLPLHIFEPRYCQMVEDALVGNRLIGMVLLKEGWEDEYDQNPPIYDVGSVGKIVRSERFEDGKFDIILYGLKKFIVKNENLDKSYRQGAVELIDEPAAEPLAPLLKNLLLKRLQEFHRKIGGSEELQSVLELGLEDDTLIATLASGLPLTGLEKQFLLESENFPQRGRRLADLIQLRLQAIQEPPNKLGGSFES